VTTLSGLPVLVLDAQATCGDPARGRAHGDRLGLWSAGEARELTVPRWPRTSSLRHPGPECRPRSSASPALCRGVGPRDRAGPGVGAPPTCGGGGGAGLTAPRPSSSTSARFEEPFLRALHERHGTGPFPLHLVCTHAIARRLLPELPRRTLRALAGYFGAGVPTVRRSAEHVAATAFLWRSLVALLAEREGVTTLDELRGWLARPPRRVPRRFPLPRERRLALPTVRASIGSCAGAGPCSTSGRPPRSASG